MSLFGTILKRAGVAGLATAPSARPKGAFLPEARKTGKAAPLRRQQENEEQAQAVRREEDDQEQPAQAISRSEEEQEEIAQPQRPPQGEDEENVQAVRREEAGEEQAQSLRRQAQEEEEPLQSIRRQEEEEEEEQAQPLYRQEEEEEEEEEEVQPLYRQQEEEEQAQPLYRQENEDEQVATLRRQEMADNEEEDVQTLRLAPLDESMVAEPADALPAPEDGPQDELPDIRALHRDALPATAVPPAQAEPGYPGESANPESSSQFDQVPFLPPPRPGLSAASPANAERPRVTIDQIDVVIHEEAAGKPAASNSSLAMARRMSTRYLRRL